MRQGLIGVTILAGAAALDRRTASKQRGACHVKRGRPASRITRLRV